jgi:hypothetical protein
MHPLIGTPYHKLECPDWFLSMRTNHMIYHGDHMVDSHFGTMCICNQTQPLPPILFLKQIFIQRQCNFFEGNIQ